MPAKIELPNIDNVVKKYLAGESIKKLASDNGISRGCLVRQFKVKGIEIRNRSSAELFKWSRMPIAQRKRQVRAAHESTKGRVVPNKSKVRSAKTKEGTKPNVSKFEIRFSEMLSKLGVSFTQQKAVWIYNLDFAIDELPIAVEIFGGGWHGYGSHKRGHLKKVKYLLDHGWTVVVIWTDERRHPLNIGSAKYVLSVIQEIRRNPSALGQYRVIRGNGKSCPACESYLNSDSIIKRLCGG